MKDIKLLKSIYTKQAILYTINLYLEDVDYNLTEDENNFIIELKWLDESDFKHIKEELTFNCLRFEISDQNKDLRKAIISQALGSINVD